MADIFLSYARSDREKAKTLAEALEEHGYSVWWDPKIPPGKTFDEVIEAAIDLAKCVIVLWSKESVKSDWVKTEASEGKRRQILVPALIADVKIPLEFRRIQAADLIDWQKEKSHQGFANLVSAVSEIVGRHSAGELGEDVKPKLSLSITEPPAKPPSKPKPPEPEPVELKLDGPKPSEPTPPEPSKKRSLLFIGAVVGVALILLVGVLLSTQQREVQSRPEATPTTSKEQRPSDKVEPIGTKIKPERVVRLGVKLQNITGELATSLNLSSTKGALVAEVISGSLAERAGLKAGDVILQYNKMEIQDAVDLIKKVKATPAGDRVLLFIRRGNKSFYTAPKLE